MLSVTKIQRCKFYWTVITCFFELCVYLKIQTQIFMWPIVFVHYHFTFLSKKKHHQKKTCAFSVTTSKLTYLHLNEAWNKVIKWCTLFSDLLYHLCPAFFSWIVIILLYHFGTCSFSLCNSQRINPTEMRIFIFYWNRDFFFILFTFFYTACNKHSSF